MLNSRTAELDAGTASVNFLLDVEAALYMGKSLGLGFSPEFSARGCGIVEAPDVEIVVDPGILVPRK